MKTLLFALLLSVFSFGATQPPPASKPAKAAGNFSAKDDARIEAAIKAKLAKSKIGADHFTVKVQGGVATWEGRTSVIQHKGAATRMAKTAGVAAVVNHIMIDEAAKRKAREQMQTGVRHAELKRSEARDQR